MRELGEDQSAFAVHGLGHATPAGRLRGSEQPGGVNEADRLVADPGALGHDQAGAGTLPVVLDLQLARHMAGIGGASTRHRRHHDTVSQGEFAEPERFEQFHDAGS